MMRVETKTKLSSEETIRHAVEFFGPKGYGLEVTEQGAACVYFEGAGGRVEVTACAEEKGTRVELVSVEWDYQVNKFIKKIS